MFAETAGAEAVAVPYQTILAQSGDLIIDAMTTGYRWDARLQPIRYSFSGGLNGEYWTDPSYVATQLQLIFSVFDYYIDAEFAFSGQFGSPLAAGSGQSDINVAPESVLITEAYGDSTLAVGIFPNIAFSNEYLGDIYYVGAPGDIYININSPAQNYAYEPGSAGFSLALHEIGHALGLKHPHDDGGTGHPTFGQAGIGDLDIDWLTIMSYDDDYNWNNNGWDPATPMILDVIALQYLYGADSDTNSGDSTFNFVYGESYYLTAYDASGTDTIDLSNYGVAAYVELPNIYISDFQVAPFGLVTSQAGVRAIVDGGSPAELNWVLGEIEKVIGTPFGDTILGSDLADVIAGSGGSDEIEGGWGDDVIDGGDGSDVGFYSGNRAQYQIARQSDGFSLKDLRTESSDGEDLVRNIELFRFADGDVAASDLIPTTATPATNQWRLYASSGLASVVGGSGLLYGTNATQDVTVFDQSGTITFDPSFNRGGDIINLSGNSNSWKVWLTNSQATLSDVDTNLVIPLGSTGIAISFADGVRTLKYDSSVAAAKIGGQTITNTPTTITAPSDGTGVSGVISEAAVGRLYLSAAGEVTVGGKFTVYGTAAIERVDALSGSIILDPSFNKGNDFLSIYGDAADFTAVRQGSALKLESADLDILIPVGTAGMQVTFAEVEERFLRFDVASEGIRFGEQLVGFTPVMLTDFA